MKETVDLLVLDAAEVVTVAPDRPAFPAASAAPTAAKGPLSARRPRSAAPALFGAAMDDIGLAPAAAIAVRDGRIVAIAEQERLLSAYESATTFSARGGVVLPGFCDAHTHPVFDTTREAEYDLRARGRSYEQITAAGGGIFSSVTKLRGATASHLAGKLAGRLRTLLACGTTSIEAKSGYGLSPESELLSLELLAEADARGPIDIDPTCLAAHQVPPEFSRDRQAYVDLVVETILPAAAARGLARSADVFCDRGAFTVDEARAVLAGARAAGLERRVHADELAPVGASELAAECGAQTADHLVHISDAGLSALQRSGTAPVLLPGTCFSLRTKQTPPARRMLEAGLPLVIASDFNPGTSHIPSMPTIIALACSLFGLTVAEAITAATRNAAATLGLPGPRGLIAPGAVADLVVLNLPSHLYLGYQLGPDPVAAVIKDGRLAYVGGEPRFFG